MNRARLLVAAGALALGLLIAAQAAAGDGYGPYPSLAAIYGELQTMAADHPRLATLDVIGQSVEGRPLYCLHVGRQDGRTRPEALYMANIHAEEVISAAVAMGTLRRLLGDDGKDPMITALLDRTDVYVIPVVNPDGYERVISTNGKGGKLGERKNAHGVDLNRNYPLAPGAHSRHPLAGNHRPRSSYYMGDHPLSEPETAAIAALEDRHHFYVSFIGHSVAGKVLYPYCFSKLHAPHQSQMIEIGQAYVAAQPTWKYKVQQSYSWYPTLGDNDDYLYLHHGVLSFTVEHGTVRHDLGYALGHPSEFWLMNPHDPEAWVANDQDAVLAAIGRALEITGGVPYDLAACAPPAKK